MGNGWIPARPIVGHNADGSLVTVDSWGTGDASIAEARLSSEEREAIAGGIAALDQIGTEFTLELARRLNGLIRRLS